MKKVNVYYIRSKETDPNERWYYISNYIGNPFMRLECGQNYELEKLTVATHLGLDVEQVNFLKRGPR